MNGVRQPLAPSHGSFIAGEDDLRSVDDEQFNGDEEDEDNDDRDELFLDDDISHSRCE